MRSLGFFGRSLFVGTAGGASIVIGPNLPAILNTFYVGGGLVSGISQFSITMSPDGASYYYWITGLAPVAPFSPVLMMGEVTGGQVYEYQYAGADSTGQLTVWFGRVGNQANHTTLYLFQPNTTNPLHYGLFQVGRTNLILGETDGFCLVKAPVEMVSATQFDAGWNVSGGDMQYLGASLPRGPVATLVMTANSAAISNVTGETTIGVTSAFIYPTGRAYRATVDGAGTSGTIAGARALYRIRSGGSNTQLVRNGEIPIITAGANTPDCFSGVFVNTSGGPLNLAMLLTLSESGVAGSVTKIANAANPATVVIEDIGPATAFAGAISL